MVADARGRAFDSGDSRFARVLPPDEVSESARAFFETTKFYRPDRPLLIHQVLANHLGVAKALNGLLEFGDETRLRSRDRRLLILRTSARTRCGYEWGVHALLATRTGELSEIELQHIANVESSTEVWGDREAALIAITDEICVTDDLSDAAWALAAERLSSAEIIEVLMVVGYYRLCSGLINSLRIPDERLDDI